MFQIPSLCLSVQVLQQEWSEGIQEGSQPGEQVRLSTGASTLVPVMIPKVEEEKRMRVAYVWLSGVKKKIVAFVERICKVKET